MGRCCDRQGVERWGGTQHSVSELVYMQYSECLRKMRVREGWCWCAVDVSAL
jgi:hypothetical protein